MSTSIAAQSIEDTAAAAGISRSTLYRLVKEGRGPRMTRIGHRRVVLISDRDVWLRSLSESAVA
ncbi:MULTISPECIES: helix-turn-helix transcriptional regulator [Rhodopseudomonas]|uniref:helix-turn-helix transcriptional regulator n=1 Tax=Rhodopseudomonas TaxID=1073 RepID=UPI0009BA67F4